ncbi:MAG: hypothetical protein IKA40_03600 [Clostridia bacterium]|nr:hypothetical protein [Clostridia bacterium]
MNQEIEYAEMLEIPVSTVNIERKKKRGRKPRAQKQDETQPKSADLKETVIAQINGKLDETPQEKISAEAALFAESANSAGRVDFDGATERIDTVRVYTDEEKNAARLYASEYSFQDDEMENDGGRYAFKEERTTPKRVRVALGIEFAAACALCGAIFLTNVFVPNSAINTFFRTLSTAQNTAADTRTYADFTLSSVVNDFTDVEMQLSPTGILTFQEKCCVYPAADGKVSAVEQNEDGTYTVRVSHSDSFTGVMKGLHCVYYAVGDSVKANVPVGYCDGESQVQVTMYSQGELLNCFELTEENCLAWLQSE